MVELIQKYFFIILVIICSTQLLSQSLNNQKYYPDNSHPFSSSDYFFSNYEIKVSADFIRMDSIITNSVQGSSSKHLFQYNENNKISEWLILGNIGSGWFNSYLNNLVYDEQGNLITEIHLNWNINKWDSSSRINYSYEMGTLSQSVFQVYTNNSWDNWTRFNYVYDTNQNLLTTLDESWINNEWQNSLLISNYYSIQNKKDSILFQTWVNNEWQNDKMTLFYYNENEIDLDSLVVKSWTGSSWSNYLKREIVNDVNHNQIEQLDKIWDSSHWLNSIRRFFTYNESNFIESAYCEIWYNNQWMNGVGDILFQSPDGFIVGFITHNVFAYYSKIVSVGQITDYSLSQNYPNPFNPSTIIKYEIPTSNFVEIKVYNVLGKEIAILVSDYKAKGNYKVQFDSNNLPSGVYIYVIRAGDYSESKKMVLLR